MDMVNWMQMQMGSLKPTAKRNWNLMAWKTNPCLTPRIMGSQVTGGLEIQKTPVKKNTSKPQVFAGLPVILREESKGRCGWFRSSLGNWRLQERTEWWRNCLPNWPGCPELCSFLFGLDQKGSKSVPSALFNLRPCRSTETRPSTNPNGPPWSNLQLDS